MEEVFNNSAAHEAVPHGKLRTPARIFVDVGDRFAEFEEINLGADGKWYGPSYYDSRKIVEYAKPEEWYIVDPTISDSSMKKKAGEFYACELRKLTKAEVEYIKDGGLIFEDVLVAKVPPYAIRL